MLYDSLWYFRLLVYSRNVSLWWWAFDVWVFRGTQRVVIMNTTKNFRGFNRTPFHCPVQVLRPTSYRETRSVDPSPKIYFNPYTCINKLILLRGVRYYSSFCNIKSWRAHAMIWNIFEVYFFVIRILCSTVSVDSLTFSFTFISILYSASVIYLQFTCVLVLYY